MTVNKKAAISPVVAVGFQKFFYPIEFLHIDFISVGVNESINLWKKQESM